MDAEPSPPQTPREARAPSVDCQFHPAPSFHRGQARIPPLVWPRSGNNSPPHPVIQQYWYLVEVFLYILYIHVIHWAFDSRQNQRQCKRRIIFLTSSSSTSGSSSRSFNNPSTLIFSSSVIATSLPASLANWNVLIELIPKPSSTHCFGAYTHKRYQLTLRVTKLSSDHAFN